MTSMKVSKPAGWGEARLAEKAARTNRRRVALAIVTTAVVLGFPFIDGFIAGVRGSAPHRTPEWVLDAMLIPVLLLAIMVAWHNWRDADEVQRLLAVQTWAVIGFSSFLLQAVVTIAAKYIALSNPGYVAWLMSAVLGLAFYFIRRVRS
ncbi:hypothetical protein [Sphingomonas sp. GM_Shp_1]|uniref:hypothetical protein n=1 Tax=Sphingomonas sp. GM_Shp_1 TaxID=2937381 RepID=UPI00226B0260|nr:hypothetical protein [Sphingomonas sp. GM_Shp_1]